MRLSLFVTATLLVAAIDVSAQQATPATPRAAPAAHACKKPGEHPGRLGSDNQRRAWVKEANDFLACLKKYAMEQQAVAAPLYEQAKPYADAANSAIDEHNKAVGEFKEIQDKNN
ncbi:MAG TPA: hypothetical protein VNE58_15780 [Casimicrobiaceae bacterium]|nr:hypothetical protein [Casimicrobiaceae bacterium]